MAALLNLDRTRERTKWGLVVHAVAMFSFVTIYTAMTLNIQSISFIDNREFPGVGDVLPPGPVGYQFFIYSKPISIVPNVMFVLNNWLADGLLVSPVFEFCSSSILYESLPQLYRCYVIYNRKYWVLAFPILVYLGSLCTSLHPRSATSD